MPISSLAVNQPVVDYAIIGAGIIGLSIAQALRERYPDARIAIFEKEDSIGRHASGRNSGVLHSGIYYKEGSLKAQFCLNGSRAMASYCDKHGLPISRIGKVIIPLHENDAPILTMLYERARNNGANVRLIEETELRQIEPKVRTATGHALFSPETSVVDPKAILSHLHHTLLKKGVDFYFNTYCKKTTIKTKEKIIAVGNRRISYGHLFNAAGLYADKVAKACGLFDMFSMIPFKGLYYELRPTSSVDIQHLIYPVPDLNVPFLGVHFTKNIDGKVYIGPTAIPALGREHYRGWKGIHWKEAWHTMYQLGQQYMTNKQGFRTYAHHEILRFLKSRFVASAQALIPEITIHDLVKSPKVGIRAQLFDKQKRELVMDFMVHHTENETHVLNAVSPAFTSAFSFAQWIIDKHTPPHTLSE